MTMMTVRQGQSGKLFEDIHDREGLKRKRRRQNAFTRSFLRFSRMALVISFFCFVSYGWYQSGKKYFSQQTAVSIARNEWDRFRFPSLTICPKFKDNAHLITSMLKPEAERRNLTFFHEMDYLDVIAPWVKRRTDFLSVFSHSPDGDPSKGVDVLNNDSYWVETIPHVKYTGMCHTYNPPFSSKPSVWNGLRFGFKFPDSSDLDAEEKTKLLDNIDIFIHDQEPFSYFVEDDRPNHKRLYTSDLVYMKENHIVLNYRRYTAMNTEARPCDPDENYSLQRCLELHYSGRRGCQPPWYYYSDADIPLCDNMTAIVHDFIRRGGLPGNYYTVPYRPTTEIAWERGCDIPCTTSHWDYDIEYHSLNNSMHSLDNGAEWVLVLWFKNLLFQYEHEYIICDYTCVVGEIGGNLGLFLGGSVLAFVYAIVDMATRRMSDWIDDSL